MSGEVVAPINIQGTTSTSTTPTDPIAAPATSDVSAFEAAMAGTGEVQAPITGSGGFQPPSLPGNLVDSTIQQRLEEQMAAQENGTDQENLINDINSTGEEIEQDRQAFIDNLLHR